MIFPAARRRRRTFSSVDASSRAMTDRTADAERTPLNAPISLLRERKQFTLRPSDVSQGLSSAQTMDDIPSVSEQSSRRKTDSQEIPLRNRGEPPITLCAGGKNAIRAGSWLNLPLSCAAEQISATGGGLNGLFARCYRPSQPASAPQSTERPSFASLETPSRAGSDIAAALQTENVLLQRQLQQLLECSAESLEVRLSALQKERRAAVTERDCLRARASQALYAVRLLGEKHGREEAQGVSDRVLLERAGEAHSLRAEVDALLQRKRRLWTQNPALVEEWSRTLRAKETEVETARAALLRARSEQQRTSRE